MLPSAPEAAYVHIPFCRRRCFYCDFPISVVGHQRRGETSGAMAEYVTQLCNEIHATPVLNAAPLQTLFFGGGTPSLLAVEQLAQILTALDQRFGLAPNAEISMEMDPGTFDAAHLQGYSGLGVNRVSLGVQAFQDELLAACGRFHRVADVYQAVGLLRAAAVTNWSLDLMSGLPHQTTDQWEASLADAIALAPSHLSIYDLTLEPQTPFGRYYSPGANPLPSEAATVAMYRLAQRTLTEAGYEHYEISNYARPGYQCRHNRVYWENRPYYGFGMGAASYTQQQRFNRPRTRRQYSAWLDTYIAQAGRLDCPATPPGEQLLDQIMVGLRLSEGIPTEPIRHTLGNPALAHLKISLQPYLTAGTVILEDKRLRLSDPDGFLISNTILAEIFHLLGNAGAAG